MPCGSHAATRRNQARHDDGTRRKSTERARRGGTATACCRTSSAVMICDASMCPVACLGRQDVNLHLECVFLLGQQDAGGDEQTAVQGRRVSRETRGKKLLHPSSSQRGIGSLEHQLHFVLKASRVEALQNTVTKRRQQRK